MKSLALTFLPIRLVPELARLGFCLLSRCGRPYRCPADAILSYGSWSPVPAGAGWNDD